jgi:hypothetical protein
MFPCAGDAAVRRGLQYGLTHIDAKARRLFNHFLALNGVGGINNGVEATPPMLHYHAIPLARIHGKGALWL